MVMHPKHQISEDVRDALVPSITKWQEAAPERLLSTSLVVARMASALDVSGGVVRKHLTGAVADGEVIEILVRRDWLLVPQYHVVPGCVYAVPDGGDLYRMVTERPESRGSNGISFLTSVSGYENLLSAMAELVGE